MNILYNNKETYPYHFICYVQMTELHAVFMGMVAFSWVLIIVLRIKLLISATKALCHLVSSVAQSSLLGQLSAKLSSLLSSLPGPATPFQHNPSLLSPGNLSHTCTDYFWPIVIFDCPSPRAQFFFSTVLKVGALIFQWEFLRVLQELARAA